MKARRLISSSIMGFEHKKQPVASTKRYRWRLFRYFIISLILLSFSLAVGTIGYWYFGQENVANPKPSWIDSFLCASMILTGMGPIGTVESDSGKIFSALYAIYSGVTFLSVMAIFFSPIIHRFLHLLHMDEIEKDEE